MAIQGLVIGDMQYGLYASHCIPTGQAGYNVTHHIPLDPAFIGTAVGDHIGLYPHAYLHRATFYTNKSAGTPPPPAGYSPATDVQLARAVFEEYVLPWNVRWTDGTIARDTAGNSMAKIGWKVNGDHQYIWGDDGYMALVLPSRLIVAGLDDANGTYASFIANQNMLMEKHLLDPASGLFWHGADAKARIHSCCKWGRANGWTLMSSAEVLAALHASSAPAAVAARPTALAAFQQHAAALVKVQSEDGRWHQVLDNSSTFLETSATSMYIVAMVAGVNAGWLDSDIYTPVIKLAWQGLSSVIHSSGEVDHICDGFGIHPTMESYEECPQLYGRSQPGLGSVLKAAVLAVPFFQSRNQPANPQLSAGIIHLRDSSSRLAASTTPTP